MLAPRKKSYDQTRQHIKKQRHYFADKGLYGQIYGFPVVMYGYESCTIRKLTASFWTVVLGKTLESPLDCKEIQAAHPKGNQSWIYIGMTNVESETPILFGHLMWRTDSFEKTMLRKTEDRRRRGWQRIKCLDGTADSMDMSLSRLWGLVMNREAWHTAVHGITKSRIWLSDWTELNWI